jgi:hypothetical protein
VPDSVESFSYGFMLKFVETCSVKRISWCTVECIGLNSNWTAFMEDEICDDILFKTILSKILLVVDYEIGNSRLFTIVEIQMRNDYKNNHTST